MGFADFLRSIVDGLLPSLTDNPSCEKCINCKARIKQLPSGKQIRVFCCPHTGDYDEFSNILPSVNPNESELSQEYIKKYIENLDQINSIIATCVEQPGGISLLRDNNYRPITRQEDLKYCTENLYNCNSFKPRIIIDNSGSALIMGNEMIYSSLPEYYYEYLTDEEKEALNSL